MSLHGSLSDRNVWRSSNVASPQAAVVCILFHGLLGDFLFLNSPSFLPHSVCMEAFAGGFPVLVSPFLHSSAFSVVPVQLFTLKNGSLKYLG